MITLNINMNKSETLLIKYFGFGTNRDKEMMIHMVGRKDIFGEPGRLIGYELCILKASQFRDEIPKTSPVNISPRAIVEEAWGPDFEMYVSRPKPDGVIYGTIWYITQKEFDLVREWEMVDCGAQEDAKGIAVDSKGEITEVVTQSFLNPPISDIDRIVTGDDYEPYIARKEAMLKMADEVRLQYLERIKKDRKNKKPKVSK